MSAQSVAMDDATWAVVTLAVANRVITEIKIIDEEGQPMTYWVDAILAAAGDDGCDVIPQLLNNQLTLRIQNLEGSTDN